MKLRQAGGYASCSWDRQLRVWRDHVKSAELQEQHAKLLRVHDPFAARKADVQISEYEKSHPRFNPPSLAVRTSDFLSLEQCSCRCFAFDGASKAKHRQVPCAVCLHLLAGCESKACHNRHPALQVLANPLQCTA